MTRDPAAAALERHEARLSTSPGTHAMIPRWAAPGWRVRTKLLGPVVVLEADADGVVFPQSPEEARLADTLGLAVVTRGSTRPPLPVLAAGLASINAAGSDAYLATRAGGPSVLRTR